MEEEIEDMVGDVKYTDSQKSVATSNVYSLEFTDSSSDKNNSSGKDTYVIEQYDSEDSDSYPIHENCSVIHVKEAAKRDVDVQCMYEKTNRAAATSVLNCCIGQEIFTQTSKTIFEIFNSEGIDRENIQTQTSLISISENKTVEYRIEFKNSIKNFEEDPKVSEINNSNYGLSNSVEDDSSRFPISDSETIKSDGDISEISSDDRIIPIIDDDESKENLLSEENTEEQYENISDFVGSSDSDIEEDSLMESRPHKTINENNSDTSEVPQSVDEDVEELYSKLSESIDLQIERPLEPRRFSTLTPLTEESTIKKESLTDITPYNNIAKSDGSDNETLFTNNTGVKIKMLPTDLDTFKLPPIQMNRSCPNSPHLNFLFSVQNSNSLNKSGTLPCLYEDNTRMVLDRWEIGNKCLASGESALINGRSDNSQGKDGIHLPPIHIEGFVVNSKINNNATQFSSELTINPCEDSISINEQIRELKQRNQSGKKPRSKYNIAPSERTRSPSSDGPDDSRLSDAAEKGCEVLCMELLKRLRSTSWCEVADTLEEVPRILEKFWGVIAEHRIADLIRQVSAHVESPRTQVARAACNTLASVLKNTNYTKKPDFYEAVTLLLTKTSSFNRPVRRAANVALDEIVCGVELSHAVTALCIHGIGHKSALVRCASGRLLVVCSALAGGGRGVLRCRPASAAAARSHALRALAALLDDKNTDTSAGCGERVCADGDTSLVDQSLFNFPALRSRVSLVTCLLAIGTIVHMRRLPPLLLPSDHDSPRDLYRKYAERLYAMLRPLPNFEAYYLTDVDVETASRQMKKYDKLLLCGPTK